MGQLNSIDFFRGSCFVMLVFITICFFYPISCVKKPSLKLTAILHLKMDGWKTFSFPFGMAYFEERTVSFTGKLS